MSLNATIAELMVEKGRAKGQGAAASGQIWGSALSNIGQEVAQTIKEAPARADEARAREARKAFSQVLKDTPAIEQGGLRLTNVPAIQQRMNELGFGAEGASALPHLQGVNDALTQFQQSRMSVVKAGLAGIAAGGYNQQDAADFLEHVVKPNQLYSPETVDRWEAQIKSDPAAVKRIVDTVLGPQTPVEHDPAKEQRNPITNALVTPATPKPGEGQHVINGQLVGADGKPIGAAIPQQVSPVDEARIREIDAKLNGTIPLSAKDRADLQIEREKLAVAKAAANPFAGTQTAAPTAGATGEPEKGITGDEFLKTLPPAIATQVKSYAEGRQAFPSGMALRTPYFQQMLQAVGQYDPTFDATNFNARNKARADLESPSGTGGKTINALNTALQHAGKLSDLIEALDNIDSDPTHLLGVENANAIKNWWNKRAGSTQVTNFNAVAPQLMKEIERAWRGAGGSTADIQELIRSISTNAGRQQQREALSQFVDLLTGKLDSTATQRDNVLGPLAAKQVPVLFDQNKPLIETIRNRASGAADTAQPEVGDVVSVGGKKVKITAIHPDGTFDGDEQK